MVVTTEKPRTDIAQAPGSAFNSAVVVTTEKPAPGGSSLWNTTAFNSAVVVTTEKRPSKQQASFIDLNLQFGRGRDHGETTMRVKGEYERVEPSIRPWS